MNNQKLTILLELLQELSAEYHVSTKDVQDSVNEILDSQDHNSDVDQDEMP